MSSTNGKASVSLEDAVAVALFDRSFAALESAQRDAAEPIVDRLQDWFEDNWHEWLENEDGSLPWESDPADVEVAWQEGVDAALAIVRAEYAAATPLGRGAIEPVGKKLRELADEGRPA